MQAIDSFVLLPRETLPRDQVSRSVLFQHQTQDKAATAATTVTTGAITQEANGCDEHKTDRSCGCDAGRTTDFERRYGDRSSHETWRQCYELTIAASTGHWVETWYADTTRSRIASG